MSLQAWDLPLSPSVVSRAQLQAYGRQWGETLPAGTTILLNGDLGSGKTTFVQALGEGLGIQDPIVSPTFTLIQEYFEGRLPLYHFDLYRLSESEIRALHPELYWQGEEFPLGLVAIEWPKNLPELFPIPEPWLEIELTPIAGAEAERGLAWTIHGTLTTS